MITHKKSAISVKQATIGTVFIGKYAKSHILSEAVNFFIKTILLVDLSIKSCLQQQYI